MQDADEAESNPISARARSSFTIFSTSASTAAQKSTISGRHHGNPNNSHPPFPTTRHEADLPVRLQIPAQFLQQTSPPAHILTPPPPPLRPNFTLTLLRPPPGTPPTFASFLVPLNLNKLDLRDYLWNGYGVRVKGVRSYIQQQKVRQDKPGAKRPAQRRWYRPRAIKKMMVELEEPFAWRPEPESLEP
jgi:hypothetical protein